MVQEIAGSAACNGFENTGKVKRIGKSEPFRSLADIQALVFQQLDSLLNAAPGEKTHRRWRTQPFQFVFQYTSAHSEQRGDPVHRERLIQTGCKKMFQA